MLFYDASVSYELTLVHEGIEKGICNYGNMPAANADRHWLQGRRLAFTMG
jgi:hypothetical protein